ncbi:putative zinc finger, CCHC-type containing protein [Tanacetum coccineum]
MITPTDQEPAQEVKHIWWDVCNCESFLDEAAKIDDDEDLPKMRKSSQKNSKEAEPSQPPSPPHKTPPSPHKPPPTSPPPPKLSPYNQKALSILHQDSSVFLITKYPSCSYSQEYEQEFPALTAFEHLNSRTKHNWKIKNLTTIGPTGHANTISPAEATLNWQSERSIKMLIWLQGRLRDWNHSLGEYSQLQIQQSISPKAFMSIIYTEFIGSPWEHTTHAREEFLKMKCYSFQEKDLEKHYDHMSQRFYYLNGVDDVNLKQVFLNPVPESLRNEAYRALEARNKKFLAEFEKTRKRLGTACDDKYLQIKCKDKSLCDCTHTKKKFHSKRFSSLSGKPRFSRQSSKKWKFIRKKKQQGKTSNRCLICQKRGHFARNCSDKKRSQALIQPLNQVEPVDVSDLESLYSLDDEPSDSVLCMITYSDFSSDDDYDTDSLESDSNFGVHMINLIPHVLPIQEDPPLPLAKIHLLTDAYAKPIPVIAFFDTGSSVSILNPNILPDHYWKPQHQNFMAANRKKKSLKK